jgi:hypothetical protein
MTSGDREERRSIAGRFEDVQSQRWFRAGSDDHTKDVTSILAIVGSNGQRFRTRVVEPMDRFNTGGTDPIRKTRATCADLRIRVSSKDIVPRLVRVRFVLGLGVLQDVVI